MFRREDYYNFLCKDVGAWVPADYDFFDFINRDKLTSHRLNLSAEIKKSLRPAGLADKEAAVREGDSYDFAEVVGRTFRTTAGFIGCVAVEYKNDDGGRNPGEEHGTVERLILAGCIGNKLVQYDGEPEEFSPFVDASRYADPDSRILTALAEVAAVLRDEAQS